jgi:hypothetical protein
MARLRDLSIDTTTLPGHRLLRFITIIVNIGAGPFETIGSRPDAGTSQMSVAQRIYNTATAACCSSQAKAIALGELELQWAIGTEMGQLDTFQECGQESSSARRAAACRSAWSSSCGSARRAITKAWIILSRRSRC